jgi:hypothetical protein
MCDERGDAHRKVEDRALDLRRRRCDRRLVPVTVTPDRAPAIRVDAPGKDLLLPDARGTVALTVSASDDFGISRSTCATRRSPDPASSSSSSKGRCRSR